MKSTEKFIEAEQRCWPCSECASNHSKSCCRECAKIMCDSEPSPLITTVEYTRFRSINSAKRAS